jgi:hypothetical protein
MTVVLLDRQHRDQPDQRGLVGEDADHVGAPADLAVEAFKRVRAAQLGPVLGREGVEGQDVLLGVLEHRRDLRQRSLELRGGLAEALAGVLTGGGAEDRTDQRRQQPVLVLASMPEAVAEEVHGAALPRRAEDLGQRGLQPGVGVTDRQLHADQAALDQRPEELAPERLGLGLADVQTDDLAASGLVHGVGDHHALARHAATVADLLDLRVHEHIRVAALQRPGTKRLHLLVQPGADARDLRARDPQPETLDQLIDPAGRHAAHIRLLHDREQRLLGALARLQETREVAAPPQLRDLQLDLARPRVPPPSPIAVAMRRAILRAPLAQLGAHQLADLRLHQPLSDPAHRLAHNIGVVLQQHLPDDLLDRHPVHSGHLPALLRRRP